MKTIAEIIELSAQFLAVRKADRPKRSAEELLAHILKCKRMDLYLGFDRPVVESELVTLRALLKRYGAGEPLAYTLGEVDFLGCKIKVDKRVLIPRPETEILASMIVKEAKAGQVLWDVCTGSGCIGIALKKAVADLQVALSDLSSDALAVATENAKDLPVEIYQGDLLAPFIGKKADIIVCNPPYISEKEYLKLDPSVRDFEPKLALVGGERGTEIYKRLAKVLPDFLNAGGKVFFEIGFDQKEAIKEIFSDTIWARREVLNDWAGLPRFFFLEKQ